MRFLELKLAAGLGAVLLAPVGLRAGDGGQNLVGRRVFAELLRIPVENPQVSVTMHGSRQEEGVTVEDISWAAPDGQLVPAYVMRPVKAEGRLPAIVYLHGSGGSRESESAKTFGEGPFTSSVGRKSTRLLGVARELARRGYVTLALTQRGLDNRGPEGDQAKEMLVRGGTLMGAIVREIRQGITYLEQRPDVNPGRIGVSGLSFGGITAFYTWLADLRVAAVAPICGGVGSVDVLARLGKPSYHGLYWWVPDLLERGDHGDFAAAMAPRPLMLWAPLDDIGMPKEGVNRFLEVARPAYERAGGRDALVVYQKPGEHGMPMEAFESMSRFFDAHLKE